MAGVNAIINLDIKAKLVGSNDLGVPQMTAVVDKVLSFAAGTATIDQTDLLFADERTLAASGTENLDMAGVLISPLGATITAAEVVLMYFEANAANTNSVVLFGAASNGFNGPLSGTTPKITLLPGEWIILSSRAGWAVTAGTGDLILVANSAAGTSVTYKTVILGRSIAA